MQKKLLLIFTLTALFAKKNAAQYQYYKTADSALVRQFEDTLRRTILLNEDPGQILRNQFNYVLTFYPKMLVKNIRVKYVNSITIARSSPRFSSIFKAPVDRVYLVRLSRSTRSTLDSVIIQNLSFNSQLGLIANQVSRIEDFSTGGFLDFVAWYFRHLSRKARNKMDAEAELKTLEVGLGYQLLSLNAENEKKLRIDNWQNTRGYTSYAKYTLNRAMHPALVSNFISDLPIYVTQHYK